MRGGRGGQERGAHLSSCCSGSAEQTSSLGRCPPPRLSLSLSDPSMIVMREGCSLCMKQHASELHPSASFSCFPLASVVPHRCRAAISSPRLKRAPVRAVHMAVSVCTAGSDLLTGRSEEQAASQPCNSALLRGAAR